MKKITLLFIGLLALNYAIAQRRPNTTTRRVDDTQEKTNNNNEESNDKAENRFFWGGGLTASFGGVSFGDNGGFNNQGNQLVLGITPELGYSVAKPLDVGLTFNLIYYSSTYYNGGIKIRQNAFNYGIGAFTRLHITEGFFATALVEQNFFDFTIKAPDNPSYGTIKDNVSTLNALVGVGWGTRNIGEGGFYSSILLDINKDKNSPYVISNGTSVQAFPVFRAGFIKYFRKKNR